MDAMARVVPAIVVLMGLAVSVGGCGGHAAEPSVGPVAGSAVPPDAGPSGPATAGVLVQVKATRYRPNAVVEVVVFNGSGRPLYTEDRKAACSVVSLQRLRGSTWSDVSSCGVRRPPVTVTIPADGRYACRIDLSAAPAGGVPAAAGAYRVALDYGTAPDPNAGRPGEVVSAAFTVG